MTIEYDRLKGWKFPEIGVSYDDKDAMLYALALNLGANPLDEHELSFATASSPFVLPTMASILGRIGPWMRAPETGIDYSRILVGEVALDLHHPLPPRGTFMARHRVACVHDKGEGRGALVVVAKDLIDKNGVLIATFEQTTFCRADGGFSKHGGKSDPLPSRVAFDVPSCPPDAVRMHPTLPQQALIYRLTGDLNPLHSDPSVARKAGFDRPILHGMATFGIAGWAILRDLCEVDPAGLCSISCRMSAPVFPGSVLETQMWEDGRYVLFETRADGRAVLTRGCAIKKSK